MKIAIITYAADHFLMPHLERLIEEATIRGHEVMKVRYPECSLLFKNNQPMVYYRGDELPPFDAIIPWIIQGQFELGIKVLRQFEAMGVFCLNSSQAFLDSVDKIRTYQHLVRHRINIIDTLYPADIDTERHISEHPNDTTPMIIKTIRGTRGRGVTMALNQTEIETIIEDSPHDNTEFLIQKFIKESAGTDIRAYVVGGKIIAAMKRQSNTNDFRSNLSLGGQGTAVDLSRDERTIVIRAAKSVGLNSAGVDFMRTNHGPVIIELNASAEFGIEQITGRNIAIKIIEYVERNAHRAGRKDKVGA